MDCQLLRRKAWIMAPTAAGFAVAAMALINVSVAAAAETETRIFNVKIDGKPSGTFRMRISGSEERILVESWANIATSYLLIKYKYTFHGTERWEDGRLVHLKSETNDDGKQYDVQVEADGDKLRTRVNGTGRRPLGRNVSLVVSVWSQFSSALTRIADRPAPST